MNKGQIFSIDFIIAMILVIVFIGVLITSVETKHYSEKENINFELDLARATTGLRLLTNGQYSCKTTDTNLTLPFSLNKTLFDNASKDEVKKYLSLNDTNINISINDTSTNVNDTYAQDFINLELEILTCNNTLDLNDMINSLNNNYSLSKEKINLRVGR